jgi:sugar fermentation stimulation protein A
VSASDDRGSYLLVVAVPRARLIPCGALGRLSFRSGYYVYAGSAMGGLAARLARHHRAEKRLRWHIDYLLHDPGARLLQSLPIAGPVRLECPLARELAALAEEAVPRFGCSDCRCPSHLFRFSGDPRKRQAFRRLVASFRRGSPGPQWVSSPKRAILAPARRAKSA